MCIINIEYMLIHSSLSTTQDCMEMYHDNVKQYKLYLLPIQMNFVVFSDLLFHHLYTNLNQIWENKVHKYQNMSHNSSPAKKDSRWMSHNR